MKKLSVEMLIALTKSSFQGSPQRLNPMEVLVHVIQKSDGLGREVFDICVDFLTHQDEALKIITDTLDTLNK